MTAEASAFDRMFPRLDAAQIARLAPLGRRRRAAAGEVLSERGAVKRSFYVLLSGRIEVDSQAGDGDERITIQDAGQFTGEMDIVSGRHSVVRARAAAESDLLEIDVASIRRLVQTDAELGEIFLRAFVLRRVHLIARHLGGVVLIGSSHSADTLRLKGFLERNAHPYHLASHVDGDRDARGRWPSGAHRLARRQGGRAGGARHPSRLLDDRRRREHGLAGRLPDARRAGLRQDRLRPHRRRPRQSRVATRAPAVLVRDQRPQGIRGGRRASGQHEAVASAVGEGSAAVQTVHKVMAE
jgi:CRP-like cAMP-binding protein